MAYIAPEIVAKAKEMDLLTYLKNFEPDELVPIGGNNYCTRQHDSLKISNGKWYWFSRSIGGATALDYLIKVKGFSFLDAVERITGQEALQPIIRPASPAPKPSRILLLPEANQTYSKVTAYLESRGIDRALIDHCVTTGRLYESFPYHSAVFVGHDPNGVPRYGNIRGTSSSFKGECNGSDKRYSFHIPAQNSSVLHLFESAIDLLSYGTLCKLHGLDWMQDHLLSLAGVYRPNFESGKATIPLALSRYLDEHPQINTIVLRLDRDRPGQAASLGLAKALEDKYTVFIKPPPQGKDYNDFLCIYKNLPIKRPVKVLEKR